MLTGEIRSQIDRIWDAFASGGIANPLEVIEQITYLLFLKRLDELEIAAELAISRDKKATPKRFFPGGKDSKKRAYADYRWKNLAQLVEQCPFNPLQYSRMTKFQSDKMPRQSPSRGIFFSVGNYCAVECAVNVRSTEVLG